ncbi:hypothetical protein [Pseudomonas sp. NBRC 111123]|uniref:hypothetical protein n=1 Tax=Pseudomonas sp. NBRC 111123 TaxID=1661038 RepID=UPI00210BC4D2|nr:hypothetical protein [Pseudomonas sp. NBRC 111123]
MRRQHGPGWQEWLNQYESVGVEPCKENFTQEPLAAAKKGEELGMKHNKELAPKMTDAGKLLGTREQLSDGPRDLFAVGSYIGQWG